MLREKESEGRVNADEERATRSHLSDLIAWEATLPETIASIMGISGNPVTLAPVARKDAASPVEAVFPKRDKHLEWLGRLQEQATEWGWRPTDGPACIFLAARLEWASHHFPMRDTLDLIEAAHRAVARTTHRLNSWCPRHPQTATVLILTSAGNAHCPECGQTATIDEIEHQRLQALVDANPAIPIPLAAALLNIHPRDIRQWARRGRLEMQGPLVFLGDAFDLAKGTPPPVAET
ncbi:hypothetical protein [Arcanobacterium canis]